MTDKCVSDSYTAAELAVLLKKQAADRIVKPHANAVIHHWDTWESAVEGTLEWQAAEFLMRQVGPSVPLELLEDCLAKIEAYSRELQGRYCGGVPNNILLPQLREAIKRLAATTGGNK